MLSMILTKVKGNKDGKKLQKGKKERKKEKKNTLKKTNDFHVIGINSVI